MEFIARTQLSGAAPSVSFQNIPTDFRKFFVIAYIVNDANIKTLNLTFNNDTAGNYALQSLKAAGVALTGARLTAQTKIYLSNSNLAASSVGLSVIEISKPVAGEVARVTIRTSLDITADGISVDVIAGEWTNTADLISRVDIAASSNNFAAGTRVLLAGSRD